MKQIPNLPAEVETKSDVLMMLNAFYRAGINFHPDDDATTWIDYDSKATLLSPEDAAEVNVLMEQASQLPFYEELCVYVSDNELAMDKIGVGQPQHFEIATLAETLLGEANAMNLMIATRIYLHGMNAGIVHATEVLAV